MKKFLRVFITIFIVINLIIPTTIKAVETENYIDENNIQVENKIPEENSIENKTSEETQIIPEETNDTEEQNIVEEPIKITETNNQEPENQPVPEPVVPTSTTTEKTTSNYQEHTYTYEEKSDNNYLKSLKIENVDIEPEFNKETTEYYAVVDLEVEEIEITAIAEDNKATVRVLGNTELEEGENTITILVTAEDKTQRIYKIIVTKTDNAELVNADLKSLHVSGFEMYPTFSNKIYKYNLTINEKIEKIEILAEAENENAKVEITGNNGLKEGNNIIIITVTAEDGISKREYSINTFISISKVEIKEENKLPALIIIGIGTIIALILFIKIIKNKK